MLSIARPTRKCFFPAVGTLEVTTVPCPLKWDPCSHKLEDHAGENLQEILCLPPFNKNEGPCRLFPQPSLGEVGQKHRL